MRTRMCGETSAVRATAIGDGLVSSVLPVLPVSLACWVGIGMVPTAAAPATPGTANKPPEKRDCSTVTWANPRIVRREQEESTSDPLKDDELAPNSARGSIPSRIAWTEPKPPGNAATVSSFTTVSVFGGPFWAVSLRLSAGLQIAGLGPSEDVRRGVRGSEWPE